MGKKRRNKRKKMKLIKPLGNILSSVKKEDPNKITDKKDSNIFGIHLTTQNALDSFQELSGMKGPYTVEYQHHYWAAVGRMRIDNQTLDVCIPLVLFNYPQQVSSGSVKFDMAQVEDKSIELAELATAKASEFMSKCGAKLTSTLGLQWSIVPTHTLHVHPGMMSVFSGTDYDKKVDDPGVVFPLSQATDQASFSSIMGHSGSKPKLLRTEYRLFTGTHEGEKSYRHGKCISYVKKESKKNGPIEAMFVGEKEENQSYVFKDGFHGTQGDDILKMITDVFDKSDYEPNTDFILKENISRAGYSRTTTTHFASYKKDGKQGTLFHNNISKDNDISEYTDTDISKMRTFIVNNSDFSWKNAFNMEDDEIVFFYKEVVGEMETEKRKDIPVEIEENKEEENIANKIEKEEEEESLILDSIEESELQYNFLKEQGVTENKIMSMTDEDIDNMLAILGYYDKEEDEETLTDTEKDAKENKEIYDFLKINGISDAEILQMDEGELRYTLDTLSFEDQ